MASITSKAKFRQRVIRYSEKHGVTKTAIRYKTNRQYISTVGKIDIIKPHTVARTLSVPA